MNFKCQGATILVVKDIECELINGEKEKINKYSIGTIIDEHDDYCKVKLNDDRLIKLDKKYIVINLCDVMQDEVIYSITNADKSIYHIHGNKIPGVTLEKLYMSMSLNNKLFIPLMYKSAEKLFKAEEEFLNKGLTIKIYDTYRPYYVTKYLYNILLNLVDDYYDYLNGEVNDHKYDQTDFLAAHTSTHNYAIALDMTLVDLTTGKELEMQTSIHDLSIYSVTDYNNKSANILRDVMVNNGFNPLTSEWWHFQDDEDKVDYMDFYIEDNEIIEYEK